MYVSCVLRIQSLLLSVFKSHFQKSRYSKDVVMMDRVSLISRMAMIIKAVCLKTISLWRMCENRLSCTRVWTMMTSSSSMPEADWIRRSNVSGFTWCRRAFLVPWQTISHYKMVSTLSNFRTLFFGTMVFTCSCIHCPEFYSCSDGQTPILGNCYRPPFHPEFRRPTCIP